MGEGRPPIPLRVSNPERAYRPAEKLEADIPSFIRNYDQDSKPFVWRRTPGPILEPVVRSLK